jgi:hypothetical protein
VDPLKAGDPGQVGGYRLLGRLGGGGMGQVFLGASPGGRKVAVKLIRPEYAGDIEFRRRFAREIEAARQVGGFHTAMVVDADPDADPPWMVTAYIPGPSLAEAVARDGPLSAAAVRELGAALAEGLTAIHACGLIHRDLKPGNIILAADGPRIIDFGVARAVDASALTAMNAVIGTYGYMSPEQLGRRELTARIDIFALGGVLVFAATGHGPFDAPDLPAVIGRILSEPPDLAPLTGSLRDVISACLDKEPGSRPALDDLLAYFSAADPGPWRGRVTPEEDTPAPGDARVRRPAGDRTPTAAVDLPVSSTVTHGGPAALALAGPPLDAHAGLVTLVTFSPDGRLLATAAQDGKIRLWDTGSWRQAGRTLSADPPSGTPRGQFEEVVFAPDGRVLIAAASGVPAVLAWDVPSGRRRTTSAGADGCISPDGRFLAAEGKGAPLLWEWDPDESRHIAAFHLWRTTNKRIGSRRVLAGRQPNRHRRGQHRASMASSQAVTAPARAAFPGSRHRRSEASCGGRRRTLFPRRRSR